MGIMESKSLAAIHFRRNYSLGLLNGALFGFIDSVVSPYLVLPLFITGLGGSAILVGLLPAIYNGGWFLPQFLISHRLQRLPRKLAVYNAAAIVRIICWSTFTIATFFIANSNPDLLLLVFFILFITYNLAAGVAGTPFMDIVAKTIPANRRGGFFGSRDLVGALCAIGAGYVINLFLGPEMTAQFPLNFAFIFLIAAVVITAGVLSYSFVVEPPAEPHTVREVTFREQVTAAKVLLRDNHRYLRYLFARILLAFADIASPFYAIYATSILHVPLETVGAYIVISTVSSLVTNPILSRLSDRRGNRIVVIGAAIASVVIPAIALVFGFLPNSPSLGLEFGLVFVFTGIARTASNISLPSYLLDIAPPEERPLYLGVTNSILGIATFIPVFGGVIVNVTGFFGVIVLALGFSAVALWLAIGLVEPRKDVRLRIA
jgi:MFS family permease